MTTNAARQVWAMFFAFALFLFPQTGLTTMADAAAIGPRAPVALGDGNVVKVRGCHRGVRGRRRPHFHRGPRCRRVNVGRRIRHCHRSARRHGGVHGRSRRVHRHVGRNCRTRVLRRFNRPRRGCIRIGPVYFCD